MPIKHENKARYPVEWPEIRRRILRRADDRCEKCGVRNYSVGYRERGAFKPLTGNGPRAAAGKGLHFATGRPLTYAEARAFADDANQDHGDDPEWTRCYIVIVLTCAHLNHTPEDSRDDNLLALCQQDHLRHDIAHHRETAARTRRDQHTLELPL